MTPTATWSPRAQEPSEWDAENRLLAVKQGGNVLAHLTYDGSGRRATKAAGSLTTTYVYAGANLLEARPNVGGAKRYVYRQGVDEVLADASGGVQSFYAADHLGSVVSVTDGAGQPTTSPREYDPWGNLVQGSTTGGYAFTGREWDPEVGLYYYRARYYDPRIGRLISEDPLGFQAGSHFYAYVENAPLSFTDPFGLRINIRLREKAAQYNRSKTCTGTKGATCYSSDDYMIGPCMKRSSGCGFDAGARVTIGQQFTVSKQEANTLPSDSPQTPGLTLQQHEDLHLRDYRKGFTNAAINAAIKTEGFRTMPECRAARMSCSANIDAFINRIGAASHASRD